MMSRSVHCALLAGLILCLAIVPARRAVASDGADAARGTVDVRVESRSYSVIVPNRKPRSNRAPEFAAKLKGQKQYTTKAVVLENDHLRIVVLPELGGRVTRVILKHEGKETDLFWVNDEIKDGVSWSMGGGRWSFPFMEHGRHFDETCGYIITRAEDGSATIHMDMRFDDYMTPAETKRYGRATPLRLVQRVKLSPGKRSFTWSAVVENPMPVRCGFKLWFLLRQPAEKGLHVILPTTTVTGHNAPKLEEWNPLVKVDTLQTSVFAVKRSPGPVGWYSPQRDVSVWAVWDQEQTPGAKMVLYKASERGYVEMWGGNHEVFEEAGRILPPLSTFTFDVEVHAAPGKGILDGVDEIAKKHVKPTAEEFRLLQARTHGKEPYGMRLVEEASGLVTEHGPSLWRAAQANEKILKESTDREELVHAWRRYLRVRQPGSIESLSKDFPRLVEKKDGKALDSPLAALYYMIHWLEDQPRITSVDELAVAQAMCDAADIPGTHYLRTLILIERQDYDKASAAVEKLIAQQSQGVGKVYKGELSMGRLAQPGAELSTIRPLLLRAVIQKRQGKFDAAARKAFREQVMSRHPALIEGWMLLEDEDKLRTLIENNDAGRRAAEAALKEMMTGKWRGIPRPAAPDKDNNAKADAKKGKQ